MEENHKCAHFWHLLRSFGGFLLTSDNFIKNDKLWHFLGKYAGWTLRLWNSLILGLNGKRVIKGFFRNYDFGHKFSEKRYFWCQSSLEIHTIGLTSRSRSPRLCDSMKFSIEMTLWNLYSNGEIVLDFPMIYKNVQILDLKWMIIQSHKITPQQYSLLHINLCCTKQSASLIYCPDLLYHFSNLIK